MWLSSRIVFQGPGPGWRFSLLDHELEFALTQLDTIPVLQGRGQDLCAVDQNVIRTREIADPEAVRIEFEGRMLGRDGGIVDPDLRRLSAAQDDPNRIEFEFRSRRGSAQDRQAGPMIREKAVRSIGTHRVDFSSSSVVHSAPLKGVPMIGATLLCRHAMRVEKVRRITVWEWAKLVVPRRDREGGPREGL